MLFHHGATNASPRAPLTDVGLRCETPRLLGTRVVAACVMLAAAGCGTEAAAAGNASPIVEGQTATAADVGATVAVLLPDAMCSGTLVTPRVVVTAAHCVYTEASQSAAGEITWGPLSAPSAFTVVVGAVDPEAPAPGQEHTVVAVWGDPQFPSDYQSGLEHWHDIGALVLSDDVTSTAPVPVLDPSALDTELTPRRMLDIAGYGLTDAAGTGQPSGLHLGQIPFLSRGNGEVVAGDPNSTDTCYGDSGGPLYVDTADGKRLVGATSRGYAPTVQCNSGTIFTTASAYIGAIEGATGQSLSPPPTAPEPVDAGAPPSTPPPAAAPPEDAGTGSGDLGAGADRGSAVPAGDGGAPYSTTTPLHDRPPVGLVGGCSAAGEGSAPGAPFASAALLVLVALAPRRRSARRA